MKKRIFNCAVSSAVIGAILFACACAGAPAEPITLTAPKEPVDIHTAEQAEYLAGLYTHVPVDGRAEKSRPDAALLEWQTDVEAQSFTVEIFEGKGTVPVVTYTAKECKQYIYNLKIGTDYSWKVTAEKADGEKVESGKGEFKTADIAPRNLYVDGVTNVRDLGGWHSNFGGRVKQGMIYRCGRLNKSYTTDVEIEITASGISTMKDTLGVKSELDLRHPVEQGHESGGITSSPLGEGVRYYNVEMEYAVSDVLEKNRAAIVQVFSLLADAKNYPLIFHCNIGTDRTGLIAYLVNGLLGVDEDGLYRDYLFSNFGNIGLSRDLNGIESKYVNKIKAYEGDSLAEKIENCLLGMGVPQAHLDAIFDLLYEA